MPPKPKAPSVLADPTQFVRANAWNAMKVSLDLRAVDHGPEVVAHFVATSLLAFAACNAAAS